MPEPAELVHFPSAKDPQVQAAEIVAAALDRAVDRFGPAADAVVHLADAQKRLCSFLVNHRLKIAASVPVVLITVGAGRPAVNPGSTASAPPASAAAVRRRTSRAFLRRGRCFAMSSPLPSISADRLTRSALTPGHGPVGAS